MTHTAQLISESGGQLQSAEKGSAQHDVGGNSCFRCAQLEGKIDAPQNALVILCFSFFVPDFVARKSSVLLFLNRVFVLF